MHLQGSNWLWPYCIWIMWARIIETLFDHNIALQFDNKEPKLANGLITQQFEPDHYNSDGSNSSKL